MIVDRTIFYAKWGRVDELKEVFKTMMESGTGRGPSGSRLLTDLSGRLFKLVLELDFDSLAQWEEWRSSLFADPMFAESFSRISELSESGERELYTLEYRA